jgi:carbon starvation protein CstA
MITEGLVAMIWAAVAMSFFGGVNELNTVMAEHKGNAAWIVNEISNSLLGGFGAILAIIGVVAAPITSGDTAFRSARLIVADFLKLKQGPIKNRLYITVPLFIAGFVLTQMDFDIIWRYMAWSNQTLATIVLWAITVYLALNRKFYWIMLIPAIFMTSVVTTYLFVAPEGLSMDIFTGTIIGISISLIAAMFFFVWLTKIRNNKIDLSYLNNAATKIKDFDREE